MLLHGQRWSPPVQQPNQGESSVNSSSDSTATVTRLRAEPVVPSAPRSQGSRASVEHPSVTPDDFATAISGVREEMGAYQRKLLQEISNIKIPEARSDGDTMKVILSSFASLGYALSARALLLLALLGAFVLAVLAMEGQSVMGLWILGVYSMFTVVPVTVLEIRKTRQ